MHVIDDRFFMIWNDTQVPKVEVFVLNFMSDTYALPQFMRKMEKLAVPIVTNYGINSSELQIFPAPQYLPDVTRIRLENISISSISTSILELVNLREMSFNMCKICDNFNECIPNKFPNLLEIKIVSRHCFVTFPRMLCSLVSLKKTQHHWLRWTYFTNSAHKN